MARLIKLQDIDQFNDVVRIPDAAISDGTLRNTRTLDELTELEPAIRKILFDPNDTPHGPTEIADILTSRIILRGERRLAGFVIKGKSFRKLKSKDVTHQFVKLRTVPELSVIVLLAIGDIQDDAQRDFIQCAKDGDYDYLIIDVQDCARLLLAYGKICPEDGTMLNDAGVCQNGHSIDQGLSIRMSVRENLSYEIIRMEDCSHGTAKRYSAFILLDRHYTREGLREILQKATEKVRNDPYHPNERLKRHWSHTTAHVVWLFVAGDMEDVRQFNWIVSTQWIDPALPEDDRPGVSANTQEVLDGIRISWNENYHALKELYSSHAMTKGEHLNELDKVIKRVRDIWGKIHSCQKRLEAGSLSIEGFETAMGKMAPETREVDTMMGDLSSPPEDLKDYDQVIHNLSALLDNMCLYFTERGKDTWKQENRSQLFYLTKQDFKKEMRKLEFEREKIR